MSGNAATIASMLDEARRRFDANDLRAALDLYMGVQRLDPNNLTMLWMVGEILTMDGRIEEAAKVLELMDTLKPNDLEIRSRLTLLRYNAHRVEALEYVDFLIERDPTNSDWYSIPAYIYHAKGELDKVRNYIDLGVKNASRGVDFQSVKRHVLSTAEKREFAGETLEESPFTRDLLRDKRAVVTWSAVTEGNGRVRLRGAGNGLPGSWRARFEISDVDGGGKKNRTIAARPSGKPARGVRHWSVGVGGLEAGKTYACRLVAAKGKTTLAGNEIRFTVPVLGPPVAETGPATPVGTAGATINGAAGGSNLPTRTWFAWGEAPDRLSSRTPVRFLPPARTLRVRDVAWRAPRRWLFYALETALRPVAKKQNDDPAFDRIIRLTAPFGKDRNHLTGVGVAELVLGWDCAVQPTPDLGSRHPGDGLDFRDAEVEVTLGFPDLDAKDFLLCFWLHTYTGAVVTRQRMYAAAPWALTSQLIDPDRSAKRRLRTIRFTLPCRSDAWTFAGNNPAEQHDRADRYTYLPLHDTLADHRGNMVLIFLFGKERELPEGSFDLACASLRCRDNSLLAPGTPTRLIEWPAATAFDPAALTSGRTGDRDHYWYGGPKPKKPLEFVWDLGRDSKVAFFRLRQNYLYPADRVEVWGAGKNQAKAFTRLWRTELPAKPPDTAKEDPATVSILEKPATVRFLKLRILSGHRAAFWGLDAFEAFGDGAEPRPERDPCSLCEDLTGLPPGKKIYYRLEAENDAGKSEGKVKTFMVTADATPIIHGAEVFSERPGKTTILVRLTAMGLPTTLRATVKTGAGKTLDCPPRDAGMERTPRHVSCVVTGAVRGKRYRIDLTAENAAGRSKPVSVEWKASA